MHSRGEQMIPDQMLRSYHASVVSLRKGDFVFKQGDPAVDFFIVRFGKVKMGTISADGKEFVQGYFEDGESFGEPPFFDETVYPASASAVTASKVWRIHRPDFLELLKNNFEIHSQITRALANRLIYKSMMLSELAIEEAEHRVRTLITYLRKTLGAKGQQYTVPFSRQQLAEMCGLRVETVIRIVKHMEQKQLLEIAENGKIVLR